MMTLHRTARFGAVLFLSALLVLACGEDKAGTSTDTSGSSAADDTASSNDSTNAGSAADTASKPSLLPKLDAAQLAAMHARVDPKRMKKHMDFLASDKLGGRIPGAHGSKVAREFLRDEMKAIGLEPLGHKGTFFHTYDQPPVKGNHMLTEDGKVVPHAVTKGTNVLGVLRGSDPTLAKQYVVISAHYDHTGVEGDGTVHNGAFDDAGGCIVLLEVARALAAEKTKPKRSIIFFMTDGEENGLRGAGGWLADPTVPLKDIVAHMSADPFGRKILPDYHAMWFAGADRSPELSAFVREVTAKHFKLPAQFVHRDLIPVFASDQDQFHKKQIPALWMFNLGFKFYHTSGDTPEHIDYAVMRDDAHDLTTLLVALASTDKRFKWVGSKPVTMAQVKDLKHIFSSLDKSKVLTKEERDKIKGFQATWDAALKAGDTKKVKGFDGQIAAAVVFLVYGLAQDHPGPIPPPFPK